MMLRINNTNNQFKMRSASIVSFGQFSSNSRSSAYNDGVEKKKNDNFANPMKLISSSGLLTKASKLLTDKITEPFVKLP
jgi:hypothetical protein